MKKNIILMALAVAAFAACQKSEPYQPGAPMDLKGPNVYFSAYNDVKTVLSSDTKEFEVSLIRDDAKDALSVPVKTICSYGDFFTAPETVEFPAGVDSVAFKVTVSDEIKMFQEYPVAFTVPEEYTHAYMPQTTAPAYIAKVVREDHVPYANGYYYEPVLVKQLIPAVIEYSAIKNEYRIQDPLGTGGDNFTFSWDQESGKVTMGAKSYLNGLTYGNYGAIILNVKGASYQSFAAGQLLADPCDAFVFVFDYTVSAGTLGEDFPNYFIITEVL